MGQLSLIAKFQMEHLISFNMVYFILLLDYLVEN